MEKRKMSALDMEEFIRSTRKIYRMLEDEESKLIYGRRLSFILTGDIRYMADCIGTYLYRAPKEAFYQPQNVIQLLNKLPEDRKMVLYGAGKEGEMLLPYVGKDKRFIGFCSSTKEKQKNGYFNYPVMSPEELLSRKDLSVVISSVCYRDDLMKVLKDGGYPSELIFDATLYYASEGAESDQYFGPKFMKFEEEEVFVDAGCYDLRSTQVLSKHCKRVKKVYAFEPDPNNYRKCLEAAERRNRERIVDVQVFPNGVWSEKATLSFRANGGADSCICAETEDTNTVINVPVLTIDETIDSADPITMIKMDVEGAELEALKGARKTIQRDKPKLAICIYHKPEDMWEIPLYIKELVPEYKFYIRHHSDKTHETVLYAVMP